MDVFSRFRGVRAIIRVEADEPVLFHTGKLVKTLLYSLVKEARLLRGVRGVVSPLHVSPLFTIGRREWELGEVVTPLYVRKGDDFIVEPVKLDGEYIVHVGGESSLAVRAMELFESIREALQVKIGDVIVRFKVEAVKDVTGEVSSKEIEGDRVLLYFKAPTKLFNVFTRSRLPKFNISSVEVLMVPYMLYRNRWTLDSTVVLESFRVLGNLVETYYSLTTVRPVLVPFNNRRTPAMMGRVTYLVETRDTSAIEDILRLAELVGVGQSRQNGFGTVAWR